MTAPRHESINPLADPTDGRATPSRIWIHIDDLLRGLRLQMRGDETLVLVYLKGLKGRLPDLRARVRDARTDPDASRLADAYHALRGALAYFRDRNLTDLIQTCEREVTGPSDVREQRAALLDDVLDELERVLHPLWV